MSNPNITRPLTVGGDERALTQVLLDAHASDIFYNTNVFLDAAFMQLQTLTDGSSSVDHPIFGQGLGDVEHRAPGQKYVGQQIVQSKVNIPVDDPLAYSLQLPLEDAELSKWSQVSRFAGEAVRKVSEFVDKRVAITLAKAARTAAVTNVHGGGHFVERTAANIASAYAVTDAGATAFLNDLSTMARKMDEANVPDTNRFAFISPYIRQVLTRSNRIMNRDYVEAMHGSIHNRTVGMVEGFQLILTQHMPSANITTGLDAYKGDFRPNGATGQPAALCVYNDATKGAVGGVSVAGMATTIWFDEDYDVWKIKCRVRNGFRPLEVWCAGEISVKAD